jgi:hypothetical protein
VVKRPNQNASAAQKYEGVRFRFAGANQDTELTGTVLFRDKEMVIEIPGGYGPYLIVGKQHGGRFEGVSSVQGISNRTEARWADLGGLYVGQWIEDGYEFLFSFELPQVLPLSVKNRRK